MNHRPWTIGAGAVAIAGITFLAGGLGQVSFETAQPIAFAGKATRPFVIPALSIPADTPLWTILLFWLALVLNFGLMLLLLSPELRKRVLRQVVRFAVGVLLFLLILRYRVIQWPWSDLEPPIGGQAGPAVATSALEIPAFQPPVPAPWLSTVLAMVVFWLVLLAGLIAVRAWQRHRNRRLKPLDQIADIARSSLADLASGRQWGDVVIDAYARMNEVIRRGRSLQRDASATPREFAARLAGSGLPASSIDELTRLFESVRYGGQHSDLSAGRRAAACLASIVKACEGSA